MLTPVTPVIDDSGPIGLIGILRKSQLEINESSPKSDQSVSLCEEDLQSDNPLSELKIVTNKIE